MNEFRFTYFALTLYSSCTFFSFITFYYRSQCPSPCIIALLMIVNTNICKHSGINTFIVSVTACTVSWSPPSPASSVSLLSPLHTSYHSLLTKCLYNPVGIKQYISISDTFLGQLACDYLIFLKFSFLNPFSVGLQNWKFL